MNTTNPILEDRNIPESQIYYFRSGGNDSYNGTQRKNSLATIIAALTKVQAQSPTINNQFSVYNPDGGIFDGSCDMTNTPYTKIFAPNAIIKTNDGTIQQNCSIHVKEFKRSSGIAVVLLKKGTGKAFFKAENLSNPIPTGGNVFVDAGEIDIKVDELTVAQRTDTLITANPATSNKRVNVKGTYIEGEIFTTSITDEYWITGDNVDCDLNGNANSIIHLRAMTWTGRIVSGDALALFDIQTGERLTDPNTDSYNALADVRIDEGKKASLRAYLSANQSAGISTITPVIFNTISGTSYQITLNPVTGQMTIPTHGKYLIEAGLALDLSAVGQSREIYIYVNGVLARKDTERQQNAGQDKQNANIINELILKKGDLVDIRVYSDASPAININGTLTYADQTYFEITKK
jgi:hypothetical protein